MELEDDLSPPALTIRAQTIPLNDSGRLRWDLFFPRVDADSIVIRDITQLDLRRVSDRREWGTRGRLIDFEAPSINEWEMTPIESYFQVGEREIQKLTERALGNDQMFRTLIAASIPARVDALARANLRRIEVEAFEAWALGQITARNPHTGAATVLDLNYAAARYQTAGADWDTTDAYDNFLAWLEDGAEYVGEIQGTISRTTLIRLIQTAAPASLGLDMTRLSRTELEEEISSQLGRQFNFIAFDDTLEPYTDGGITTAAVNVWPADVIAAIPASDGGRVGSTHFAPVARAYEIAQGAGADAGIDIRGQTVYGEISGNGRQLTEECQVNALTIPAEGKMWVMNVNAP